VVEIAFVRPLIVLRAGDAAAPVAARRGEYFGWIIREIGPAWSGPFVEHDVRDVSVPLPDAASAAGFVITGSSSSVTERAPWMLRTEAFIRELVETRIPLFGICFGHQMMAEALGGSVARNVRGREIGTVRVRSKGIADPVLDGLPSTFLANATHVDTVEVLPSGATVLAETDLDPHAIYSYSPTAKGVQFHPEIDGDAMRGWVEARRPLLLEEGLDPDMIHADAVDAPGGAATLRNFVRHIVAR
jgi:GMP synthase (glutamine-hydrolysing)